MRRMILAVGALLAVDAAPALAQVTGVVTETTARLQFRPGADPDVETGITVFSGDQISEEIGDNGFGSGGAFASTSRVGDGIIEFQNGNASGGAFTYMTSRTLVDISFRNDGDEAVVPMLHSTITPAGLGLYTNGDCLGDLTACGPGQSFPGDFRDFDAFGPSAREPVTDMIAGASFTFRIIGGGTVVYELEGSVALMDDPSSDTNLLVSDLADAQAALAGFRLISAPGSRREFGFAWDATDLLVDFPDGTLLQPGESSTLTYETIVNTVSRADCYTLMTAACITAYSSFGDPVGRGGGVRPTARAFAAEAVDAFTGLSFNSFAFRFPTFRDGVLSYELISAVPEPATVTTMLAGLGLVGMIVRRRRHTTA